MTSKDVIDNLEELLSWYLEEHYDSETFYKQEAVEEVIKAVKEVEDHHETFEWCDECKEYDQENHCCHRWSKQIKKTCVELREYHDEVLKEIAKEIQNFTTNELWDDCNNCIAKDVCKDSLEDIGCDGHIFKWMKGVEDRWTKES